jgi:hypothetical protein
MQSEPTKFDAPAAHPKRQMSRIHTLDRLSEIVIDGVVTRKLDFLGTVFIHGRHYFNVFRRYNSPYEIVLEDSLGDFHFHRNYTVRESVQRIMCYTDEAISELYAEDVVAFKNQAPVHEQVVDMHWTEIQARYAGAAIRLVGVPNEWYVKEEPISYHAVPPFYNDEWEPLESNDSPSSGHLPVPLPPAPPSPSSPSPPPSPQYEPSAPSAPIKEDGKALRQGNAKPCNLSDRFSALSAVNEVQSSAYATNEVRNAVNEAMSPRVSMENFPEFRVLRSGKKIPK